MLLDVVVVEGGILPHRATDGAAGWDCYARGQMYLPMWSTVLVPLGFKLAVPYGFHAQIRPRSGLASQGIVAHFGTIDSDYRGEVCAILQNTTTKGYTVRKHERMAQLVVQRHEAALKFNVVKQLDVTERSEGGFGSTGATVTTIPGAGMPYRACYKCGMSYSFDGPHVCDPQAA